MSNEDISASTTSLSYSQQQAYLLDRKWEDLQAKTFTKWINSKIRETGTQIENIIGDELSDGTVLATLLTCISEDRCVVNRKPTMRIHKIENVNKCLDFIKEKNVNLVNIGSTEIVDGNSKLLLGMIWTIILRFTISEISSEGRSAREGLLLWCQRRLEKEYGIRVENFTNNWADGRAYVALVHSQDPDCYDYHEVVKKSDKERAATAFEVANERFGVAKLLDPEDTCMVGGPDERSNLTYIAQLFHSFSQQGNRERAMRRANNFAKNVRTLAEMSHDYETRTKALLQSYKDTTQTWEKASYTGNYSDIVSKRTAHRVFRQGTEKGQKRQMISEKRDLITLYSNIQTKARSFRFKPYSAPSGLLPNDVDDRWKDFLTSETIYQKELKKRARDIRETLQHDFADSAEDFERSITQVTKQLVEITGSLEEQQTHVLGLQRKVADLRTKLPEIEKQSEACVAANIEDNDFTNYSYSDLVFDSDLLEDALRKKTDFIKNQLAVSSVSNVTAEQFQLYEATFRQMCKNDDNVLLKNDFKAAVASLNINITDEELDNTFAKVSKGTDSVTLVAFIEYMRNLEEDVLSREQVSEAFDTLAGNKSGMISAAKLRAAAPDGYDALVKRMPMVDDAYDHMQCINDICE